jgi:hypothetical protein
MHGRILIGVSAWLLGAGTATGGSLLAVSLLGQGLTGASASELTGAAVRQALASAASEAAKESAPVPLETGTVKPTGPASARPRSHSEPEPSATPAAPVASSPSAAPTASVTTAAPAQTPQPASMDGTVLTSQGGEVVAACEQGGAYLISWSPQQAYEVDTVSRGPAPQALVSFESGASQVTMTITCTNGVPSAASTTGVDN